MIYKSETIDKYTITFYPVMSYGLDILFAYWPAKSEPERISLRRFCFGYHENGVGAALVWIQP